MLIAVAALACSSSALSAPLALDSTDPLVAVDRSRSTLVSDIVQGFQAEIASVAPGHQAEESARLRERLSRLRADRLLAASLTSSYASLSAVLDDADKAERSALMQSRAKTIGDAARDLVYTPLTPCRLVDTRGFGAPIQGGPFAPNTRRSYAPAGLCSIPTSGVSSLIVAFTTQNLTSSSGGYLAILAPNQPVTATVDIFNYGSEWSAGGAIVRTGSAGEFDAYVANANAELVVDIVGYFSPPSQAVFSESGNAFGTTARLGTTDNQPLELLANGQAALRIIPLAESPALIAGSSANYATATAPSSIAGATIGGGGSSTTANGQSCNGGCANRVTDPYGTVGGGAGNQAGDDVAANYDANFATVGGGIRNKASATASTVSGGDSNAASGRYAAVGGGNANVASGQLAVVSGGISNNASGGGATIAGGSLNVASGDGSTISGGSNNGTSGGGGTIGGGTSNMISGGGGTISGGALNTAASGSAIGGGSGNTTSGISSSIGGGTQNVASGIYSAVPGGLNNIAAGFSSLAAGTYANANADGCVVFGDFSSVGNYVSCGAVPNRFVARAAGGVYFFTAGMTDANYTGAALLPGATSWTTYSDRAGKDNIRLVDVRDVLARLVSVPIATWNWKSQDASVRHMGPMAQDFMAAFRVGETARGINTVDADGVALAAIQGLHQLLLEKDREIAQLRSKIGEIDRLKRDIRAIKASLMH